MLTVILSTSYATLSQDGWTSYDTTHLKFQCGVRIIMLLPYQEQICILCGKVVAVQNKHTVERNFLTNHSSSGDHYSLKCELSRKKLYEPNSKVSGEQLIFRTPVITLDYCVPYNFLERQNKIFRTVSFLRKCSCLQLMDAVI
jgi:hypothetical protein